MQNKCLDLTMIKRVREREKTNNENSVLIFIITMKMKAVDYNDAHKCTAHWVK